MIAQPKTQRNIPTTAQILEEIPPEYAHLKPHISKIPPTAFLTLVINCVVAGCSDEQIGAAIVEMADFSDLEDHRCVVCFNWRDSYTALAEVENGKLRMFTVCDRCSERMKAGTATPAMGRNLKSFLLDGGAG